MSYDPQKAASDPSNSPDHFDSLTDEQKAQLRKWIIDKMTLRIKDRTSYGLKHLFEASAGGFYVTNGQFKGAMLAAGYEPIDATELNWRFVSLDDY